MDEQRLISLAKVGDRAAIGELWAHHYPRMVDYLLWRGCTRELAEDLASDAWVKVLRKIGTNYQPDPRGLGPWLSVMVRNTWLDHLGALKVRQEILVRPPITDDDAPEGTQPDTRPGPDWEQEGSETRRELAAMIRQLTPEQRQAVELRYIVGLSVDETAAVMEREPGAVKALTHRAVRALQAMPRQHLRGH